jgi:hypothetical protein
MATIRAPTAGMTATAKPLPLHDRRRLNGHARLSAA